MAKLTGKARRAREIVKALRLLVPQVPMADAEEIREAAAAPYLASLPPSTAVWLATVTHVRHNLTDYDTLLDEGYEHAAARHFVLNDINAVLTRWRATRLLDPDSDDGF